MKTNKFMLDAEKFWATMNPPLGRSQDMDWADPPINNI